MQSSVLVTIGIDLSISQRLEGPRKDAYWNQHTKGPVPSLYVGLQSRGDQRKTTRPAINHVAV